MKNKRQQLINTALDIFYAKGIHGVGINEVLAVSGIAKKTLYNHFSTKEALIQACLIERDLRFMAWFTERCDDNSTITGFIEEMFYALDDWINERVLDLGPFNGCFFVNTAAEYSDSESDIKQLCSLHKVHIKQFVDQKLVPLIPDSHKRDSMVDLLLLLKEGSINVAHVAGDKHSAMKAKKIALSFAI